MGIAFIGAIPARGDDEVGLAYGRARNGPAYFEQQRLIGVTPDAHESTLELTYLAAIRPWLSVLSSFQHIRNPNAAPQLNDSKVVQIRFEVTF